MKVGFKRAPDKARVMPKAGSGQAGKAWGATSSSPTGISKKLAAAKAELAAKRALEAEKVENS
jgi:hypothetical protein